MHHLEDLRVPFSLVTLCHPALDFFFGEGTANINFCNSLRYSEIQNNLVRDPLKKVRGH